MATLSSGCFSTSSPLGKSLRQDGRDSSSASVTSTNPSLPRAAAAGTEDNKTTPVEGRTRVPSTIDGVDGRSVLQSLPSWTSFFFDKRTYQSLPVIGVISPDQLAQLRTSFAARSANGSSARSPAETSLVAATVEDAAAANVRSDAAVAATGRAEPAPHDNAICIPPCTSNTTSNAGPGASGRADTPGALPGSEREDDEDTYWHLLHDTLVVHGGVTDLQYFVSTDEGSDDYQVDSVVDAAAAKSDAAKSAATTAAQTNTISTTDSAEKKTEGKQTRVATSAVAAAAGGTVLSPAKEDAAKSSSSMRVTSQAQNQSPARELEEYEKPTSREKQGIPRVLAEEPRGHERGRHLLTLCRVSRRVCGHKGVVHGGFIATLLDNAMGYLAVLLMPRPATKSLTVNYLKPVLAGSCVLVDVRKRERGGSNIKDSSSSPSSTCHPQQPATHRGGGTGDNSSCSGSSSRGGGVSSMTCCTIEARVYTCIPEQLRAAFPVKPESPFATCSHSDHQVIHEQQERPSKGSANKLNSKQCGEDNCLFASSRSSSNGGSSGGGNSARKLNSGCASTGNPEENNSCERQENRCTTNRTKENSVEGNSTMPAQEQSHQQPPRTILPAASLPPNVWLVATAEAIFVDVSAKWKSLV